MGQLSAAKSVGGPSPAPFTGFGLKPMQGNAATGSGFSFAVGKSEPPKQLGTVMEGAGIVKVCHQFIMCLEEFWGNM